MIFKSHYVSKYFVQLLVNNKWYECLSDKENPFKTERQIHRLIWRRARVCLLLIYLFILVSFISCFFYYFMCVCVLCCCCCCCFCFFFLLFFGFFFFLLLLSFVVVVVVVVILFCFLLFGRLLTSFLSFFKISTLANILFTFYTFNESCVSI